ncbi:MAG: chemotaxis protein CheR [Cytophagales bacterium]|nr:chemotaxis protein CheR [Cytophagales bacterium]
MELINYKNKADGFTPIRLTNHEFNRLSVFIENKYGIRMPISKKSMLQGRLQKRLKALNISDFKTYNDYLFSVEGLSNELSNMIDEVSTNKTDFFREKIHFDFLTSDGLKQYLNDNRKNNLSVWSAACSSGEEPYSISITLNEYKAIHRNIDFQILGTDISNKMISFAQKGIYGMDKASAIPQNLLKKYFLRGKNQYTNKVKVKDILKNNVVFKDFNLLSANYHKAGKHDIIFCRNVLIYFDQNLQYRVLRNLCQQLRPGGYLFLGHTESIIGFSLPLIQVKPSIFIRTA